MNEKQQQFERIVRVKFHQKKKNAQLFSKRDTSFELDYSDFYHMMVSRRCFYLGTFVSFNLGGPAKAKWSSATVDRLDSREGYTLINSALASKKANEFKGQIECNFAKNQPPAKRRKRLEKQMKNYNISKRQVRAILNKCPELNNLYGHLLDAIK